MKGDLSWTRAYHFIRRKSCEKLWSTKQRRNVLVKCLPIPKLSVTHLCSYCCSDHSEESHTLICAIVSGLPYLASLSGQSSILRSASHPLSTQRSCFPPRFPLMKVSLVTSCSSNSSKWNLGHSFYILMFSDLQTEFSNMQNNSEFVTLWEVGTCAWWWELTLVQHHWADK